MINKDLKNIYFQNCIDIIENYQIVTYDKEFYDDFGLLAEPSHYLGPQFDPGYYNIKNTSTKTQFHYTDHIERLEKYYEKYGKDDYTVTYQDAIKNKDKKIIISMGFHPRQWNVETLRINFFDKLFEDKTLLGLIQDGHAHLYLYFGYEADNFYFQQHDNNTYDKVFSSTIRDYDLPLNGIIIHSSNAIGYDQHEIEYGDSSNTVQYIYETAYESQTFTSVKGDFDINYTFDEYLDNCKKADKTLLRINRTSLNSRDMMLVYLYKKGLLDKCLIEHKNFGLDLDNLIDYSKGLMNAAHLLNLGHLFKYFKLSDGIVTDIRKLTPFVSSELEKRGDIGMIDIYSNESIPHDVYKKTIFSWVSTSLSEREDQVFINTSTYNPILHYHPIVYHGNRETARFMHLNGYLSYNWLYNEEKQDLFFHNQGRLAISIDEIDKIMAMSKDDLIDLINQNKHIMKFNRQKLLTCDSIRRIINRLHFILHQ